MEENLLLFSEEPLLSFDDDKDFTTRSQDTLDSFGDFVDDIDVDLSDDIDVELSDDNQNDHGDLSEDASLDHNDNHHAEPRIPQQSLSSIPFLQTKSTAVLPKSTFYLPREQQQQQRQRQIPARAVSYSEGDQHQHHFPFQMHQQQHHPFMHQQNSRTAFASSSSSSLQANDLFRDNNNRNHNHCNGTAAGRGDPLLFSQQQQQLPMPSNPPNNLNDAMEKLCETMKRSAVTRNLVKQLSGVQRSNSSAGIMRTHSSSKNNNNIGDMARMAPIRRPSHSSKHKSMSNKQRGVLRQTSQQSLDGSNHRLSVDGRSVGQL